MKIQELIDDTNIPESLVRAVVRQFGGWESFCESAQDVANNSIDGGFHGFIYYKDTAEFARHNKAAILELAKEQAQEFGSESVHSMIGNFGCLKMPADEVAEAIHNPRSENRQTVFNALAWYAGEEVCRAYDSMFQRV